MKQPADLSSGFMRPTFGLLFATFMSIRGLRKKSLSRSGAIAAWVVGFISMTASWRFGAILILFYQSSSSLTKYKADVKARLEDHFREGGQRSAAQVLACSAPGTLLAIIFMYTCGADAPIDFTSQLLRSRLLCAYVGHYACCNGDTWASELGILSPHRPKLITSGFRKEVPKGTNGGMSLVGTLASIAGGAFIGAGFTILGHICGVPESAGYLQAHQHQRLLPPWLHMTVVGALCGFLGSLLDSLIGAIWQASWYCPERKCVIQSPTPKEVNTGSVVLVCGRDILSNEHVNLITVCDHYGVAEADEPQGNQSPSRYVQAEKNLTFSSILCALDLGQVILTTCAAPVIAQLLW